MSPLNSTRCGNCQGNDPDPRRCARCSDAFSRLAGGIIPFVSRSASPHGRNVRRLSHLLEFDDLLRQLPFQVHSQVHHPVWQPKGLPDLIFIIA